MEGNIDIVEIREGDTVVVAPSGRLDAATSVILEDRMKTVIKRGEKAILLDLVDLEYMSSAGMRVLMVAAKGSKRAGTTFAICRLQSTVEEVLSLGGMTQLYTIFADRSSAIAEMGVMEPLTFPEEIMLLILDDKTGSFLPVPEMSMRCALAGAALMELALANRIDTDQNSFILVNAEPTGNNLLDPTLKRIAESGEERSARYWVESTAVDAETIRKGALASLVEKGILSRKDDRLLWVFGSRSYPIIDGAAEKEVKQRLFDVIRDPEAMPDPRDVVMIGLCNCCGLFQYMLTAREMHTLKKRIEELSRMDLIGQAVSASVRDIQVSLDLTSSTFS